MEKFNSKLFVSLALLTAIAFFFVLFKRDLVYQTELDILIIPKNEKTAQSFGQTVESIKQIPLSLSFYDRMLETNKNIEDGAIGQNDYGRKAFWNKKISSERVGDSGVIRLKVSDRSQLQAEAIASQLKNDFFVVISKYYNVKTDLEPRLIDGPITGAIASGNILSGVLGSIVLGLVFSFFMTIILSELAVVISKRKRNVFIPQYSFKENILPKESLNKAEEKSAEYNFSSKKSAAEEVLENIKAEEAVEENIKEVPLAEKGKEACFDRACMPAVEKPARSVAGKKAGAPGNLPFSDEEMPDIFSAKKTEQIIASSAEAPAKEDIKDSYKEATPEEVKARLRKLLDGKF